MKTHHLLGGFAWLALSLPGSADAGPAQPNIVVIVADDMGFDHFFGFLNGFTDHFAGSDSYRLDREPFREFGPDYYSSDAFTDRAIQFIEAAPGPDRSKPFLLYLSYQAPHNPLQAPRADILKHRRRYTEGRQAIREARVRRQKQLGIVPFDAQLPDYPRNLPDGDSLTALRDEPWRRESPLFFQWPLPAARGSWQRRSVSAECDASETCRSVSDALIRFSAKTRSQEIWGHGSP